MNWLSKQRDLILQQWKENKIGYMETVSLLHATGMNLEKALRLVART